MASTTAVPPIAADATATEPLRMSYDEYVAWYDREAGQRGEWVDGEVIVFLATTFRHERLAMFLGTLLNIVLRRRRRGVVLGSGYELRVRDGSAREPDLMVVLNEHLDRATDRRMLGAADLVVEIVSPDSVTRDRRDKLAEYAAAGVPEYWVIDPREGREAFELFALGDDGYYVTARPDEHGRAHSAVLPGVWFDAAWLTADELPDEVELGLAMAETVASTPVDVEQ